MGDRILSNEVFASSEVTKNSSPSHSKVPSWQMMINQVQTNIVKVRKQTDVIDSGKKVYRPS